ncbi:placenta-expressed transcript 1 protein [Phacochoerus africanus]|uniref:placenta-expressed transcript 1 protein n=1 Tax=Phacochoerus africanus TaxID=41426 RepID=UPI001FD95EDA|nr:placenta-expressed transcript 1 protein [Phacochoerus africanus]
MAVLGSPLLPLRLFLCFGLLFFSASCTDHTDQCMIFNKVTSIHNSRIQVNPKVYESNTVYTVSVPVNNTISSVVMKAVDMHHSVIGFWQKADRNCTSSALYHVKSPHDHVLEAKWLSPASTNINAVELQVFVVDFHKEATASVLKLEKSGTSPALITKLITTKSNTVTTTKPAVITTHTTHKNSANRVFRSPVRDAIQILLAFLTSKLLF